MVSKTPLRQVTEVRQLLSNEHARAQLATVAASHMSPERMMRLLALALDKTRNLDRCTPLSVLGCMMTCASLGLEANTPLQHAYIIPFKNGWKSKKEGRDVYEAQLIIGYRGYVQLAHNSDRLAGISVGVHYSDDHHWAYRKGTAEILEHEEGPQKGEKLHAYACVRLTNGSVILVCWPWAKILAHRDQYSKGWQDAVRHGKTAESPWTTAEDAMAIKTMIRQLTKFMPMASEVVHASVLDGARADYAAFAMDPSRGLPVTEGDDDGVIEGDIDTGGDVVETEASAAPKEAAPAASAAPAADPMAEVRARAQAAAAAKKTETKAPPAETPAAAEPTPEASDDDEPSYAGAIEAIYRDVVDYPIGRSMEVLDFHDTEMMQEHAPKQFAELIATLEARDNGEEATK